MSNLNWSEIISKIESVEELMHIKTEVDFRLIELKNAKRDRRLEDAILFLAGRCDGAVSLDGVGFNGADTRFGHWLADRICAKQPILAKHAEAALKMLKKYEKTQLRFELPSWSAIAGQYGDTYGVEEREGKPDRRIEIIDNKVAVFSPYDPSGKFQRDAKSLPGYKFNNADKSWRYPLERVEEVVEKFEGFDLDPDIEGTIAMVRLEAEEELAKKQTEALTAATEIVRLIEAAQVDEPLPCGLTLFDHQKEAVKWLLAHRKGGIYRGGILADQMGLGKSFSALVAAKAMKKVYNCHIFVIAPASLRDNWLREAERVEIAIEVFSWAKLPTGIDTREYIIIADECHFAQNIRSNRTKRLIELADRENCLASWLLSGTPIKNGRPINLYPLLQITKHPLAESLPNYQKYFCNAHYKMIRNRQIWDASGAAHLDELSEKTKDVMLRRTKKECLNLPPKIRSLKPVELSSDQQGEYDRKIEELKADYQRRIRLGEVDDGAEALVTINILRKIGSQYKVDTAMELVDELLDNGQSAVVFTEYVDSAKIIYEQLSHMTKCEILTGETPQDERQKIVDRFQSGESKVFVGTIKAGGVGLTLTAASDVILVDRPLTPGDAEQAEDRLHRISQNETVNSYWIQLGVIDLFIDALLEQKQERIDLVLKGKRKTLRGIDSIQKLAKELMEII